MKSHDVHTKAHEDKTSTADTGAAAEQELVQAEERLQAAEHDSAAEALALRQLIGRIEARQQALRAAIDAHLRVGIASPELEELLRRCERPAVPSLDVQPLRDQALRLRRAAIAARGEVLGQLHDLLTQARGECDDAAAVLDRDEQVLASAAQRPSESRGAPRVRIETSVTLDSEDNFFTSFSRNISEGGLFVTAHELQAPGTLVELAFSLPSSDHVECRGRVRWVREWNSLNPELKPGLGIQFVDLPGQALAAIRSFVALRDPLFYDEE